MKFHRYYHRDADENNPSSPALIWKMNETSGNPQDSSGNGRHGTRTGGSITDGCYGKGIIYTEFSGNVESSSWSFNSDLWSAIIRFKLTSIGEDHNRDLFYCNCGGTGDVGLWVLPSGKIRSQSLSKGVMNTDGSGPVLSINEWYTVIFRIDQSNSKYNTILDGQSILGPSVSTDSTGTHDTYFKLNNNSRFQGIYDFFAVYPRYLNDQEVSKMGGQIPL